MINLASPDLTVHPPRSARVRLGGYVILARMLDKCRAELAGKNGPYHYACPLDQNFLTFTGVDPEALKAEVASGKGDGELLEWIQKNAKNNPQPWEIAQWSAFREQSTPADVETREYVNANLKSAGLEKREDIATFFDWLDADDFASYGGKP